MQTSLSQTGFEAIQNLGRTLVNAGAISGDEFKEITRRLKKPETEPASSAAPENKLISRQEAARLLSCTPRTVDRLAKDGLLKKIIIHPGHNIPMPGGRQRRCGGNTKITSQSLFKLMSQGGGAAESGAVR
jgi:hypothetical protein